MDLQLATASHVLKTDGRWAGSIIHCGSRIWQDDIRTKTAEKVRWIGNVRERQFESAHGARRERDRQAYTSHAPTFISTPGRPFFPMKIALALLLLFLAGIGVWMFTQRRSGPSTIAPTAVSDVPSKSQLPAIADNDGLVNSERKPAVDSKTQPLSIPPKSNVGNRQNSPSVAPNPPDTILMDPVSSVAASSAEDEVFSKKYAETGVEGRRRALEDLRQSLATLTDPSQPGKVSPEVVSELKREIGWLETHSDS